MEIEDPSRKAPDHGCRDEAQIPRKQDEVDLFRIEGFE
jgi:hypothetical protein